MMKFFIFLAIVSASLLSAHDGLKVLIVGSGGREHAIAWKVAQSPNVAQVYVAPGNAGTFLEPKIINVAITAQEDLALFARLYNIDLTIIGPETYLASGIVDLFQAHGMRCF